MTLSIMKCILKIFIPLFLFTNLSYAQEKKVRLVEEVLKKRTLLYIQNDTEENKNIFLKVNPIGYRKSAQRPIIKDIPAKSKVQVMIIIPLKDTASSYTYTLIVNDEPEVIDINRSDTGKKQAPIQSIMHNEVIIFTKKDCKKCETLITLLKKKRVKHRAVNIDTKSRYRDYLWELLEKDGYDKNNIGVPLAYVKGKRKYPIYDLNKFTTLLSE